MKKPFLVKLLPAAIIAASMVSPAQAANWLMLQGTEADHQAPRAKVWGFIQAEYQQTDDTKLTAGPASGQSAAFNLIKPQNTSANSFNIRRARIGVRGANLPLDNKVNYFLLAEFGNNGITTGKNASKGQLTDASITLNHIPGARIRVGQFKTPGSEEGFQGIAVFNYINFTNMTDRLLLERHFDTSTTSTGRNGPVGAFRDQGIEVFDSFKHNGWDTSYAVMIGNGNGLGRIDNNDAKDTYLYLSTEMDIPGGKKGRKNGLKFYVWNQDGKRTIDGVEKNRTRSGLGTTFLNSKYRFAAEYVQADGMIFGGTKGAAAPGGEYNNGNPVTFNVFTDQKANGYYLDFGYRIIPQLELNVRYDALDSATENDAATGTGQDKYREFRTTTLGAQYFINKKTVLRANYEIRDIKAPKAAAGAPVHDILKSVDNRIALQLSILY